MRHLPSAPFAAGTLLAGWAAVEVTGSRPVGGVVLLCGGLGCAALWQRRHGTRTALTLSAVGFSAFVLSHVLALAIGAWPAVVSVSAIAAVIVWLNADAPSALPGEARVELG
jgi:CHASE2 domain-containing sensor protein